ncbi:MAG: hypothetical protein GX755_09860 [Syntrophomonadaceae bacterium]|nr:hypothetical protein [Syntrophomonadaceae bacterium]
MWFVKNRKSISKCLALMLTLAMLGGSMFFGGVLKIKIAGAASLTSSYEILKNQYASFIDRLKNPGGDVPGATDAEIAAFLADLDNEVKKRGTLTEANFNTIMYETLEDVITWRQHRTIFNALLQSFSEEIAYTLMNGELHPSLIPLRNAVKDSVLGTGNNSGGGGGGGGGGGAVNQPNPSTPQDETATEIEQQLAAGKDVVQLSAAQNEDSITISGDSLKEINIAGKGLEITISGVTFRLPPAALDLPDDQTFTLGVRQLSQTEAKNAVLQLSAGNKLIGPVYEFSATTEGSLTGVQFKKPVTVVLSYADLNLTSEEVDTLDVGYYNETQKRWERQNGQVDRAKKTISFTINHCSKYAIISVNEASEQQLTDLTGHWAAANINKLVAKGAIQGYPDGQFKPNNQITRAEFATVVVKAYQLPAKSGKVFDDTANHWAKEYIATAAAAGLVNGYDSTKFGPNDPVTREQMAVMIVKANQLKPTSASYTFADGADIADWAKDAVMTASENNLITGYPDNTFKPKGQATRAEAVTLIVKALKL